MSDKQGMAGYFVSWSGGKDSCLAMSRVMSSRGKPARLLTILDETARRSRSHYLRPEVLRAQAQALDVPIEMREASWEDYEDVFVGALEQLGFAGVSEGVFGDIDIAEHREWVERVCAKTGVTPHEPLWLEERAELLQEFIDSGYSAVLVAIKEGTLEPDLLGRMLDCALVEEFVSAGIDACGECGEYHTVVVDGPDFSRRIELMEHGRVLHDNYLFLDVAPAE
ncbi:MAG: diphthine--ammonia ligase [Deltaproteobacteria bacterium]|nr:diphthine--ammonia ligase [Deltaproteobacteria bacterium]